MTAQQEWTLCPGCQAVLYTGKLVRNLHVCPDCGHHGPVSADERITQLFDAGSRRPLPYAAGTHDPLGFVDQMPYVDRLRLARDRTGMSDAVVCASGTIGGCPVVAAVMDFRFLGGSLGAAVGELVTLAAETALRQRIPLLLVTASGGARMQEGALSLMQMAKTSQALGQLDRAGVLTISLITDPTFGGVAASFAALTDVILAEPGARLGFAGPRVIEQTLGEKLPKGFQTAEFLLENGFVDAVCARPALRPALARLLGWAGAAPDAPVPSGAGEVVRDPDLLPERDPWDVVHAARDLDRPTTLDYLARLLDHFEELRGDRVSGDCPAIVGGIGRLADAPVVVIGQQRGHTPVDLAARNFGMANPAGYRKAARLMRLAAKLGRPVITMIDSPGAYPGVSAEEQGQAAAIAENLRLMAGLPVPVVAVVIGEGGSGGALGLAVANRVLMLEHGTYSVISPEGCASILWKDPSAVAAAAAGLGVDARTLLRLGVVDGVITEPVGGAGSDPDLAAARLGAALRGALGELRQSGPEQLIAQRHARFREFGATAVKPMEEVHG